MLWSKQIIKDYPDINSIAKDNNREDKERFLLVILSYRVILIGSMVSQKIFLKKIFKEPTSIPIY